MEPDRYLLEETYVRTNEADFLKRWKPVGLVQAMVEAATRHAAQLGFGHEAMMGREMIWVLSRLKIKFFEFPTLSQTVKIKTWPKGIQQKLFFMRDFDVRDGSGKPLAAASFAWLLINPVSRRMLPPAALLQGFSTSVPDNGGASALDEMVERINNPDGLPERIIVQANYGTIDILGHVTAARYIEWACDCFSLDDYRHHQMQSLQLNYISETRPGEQVSISAGPNPDNPAHWYIQGKNTNTGQRSFDAEVHWQG